MLVWHGPQSDSVIYTNISTLFKGFFSHTGHYRMLSRVPYAYNRFLLVIHFIYSSVYMSIPVSQITPPPYPLVIITCFLCLWLYFCPVNKLICTHFYIPVIGDIMWYISFCVWLTSFSMIVSRSTHVAANGLILFLSMTNIPLPVSTTSSLSIYLSMNTEFASMFLLP